MLHLLPVRTLAFLSGLLALTVSAQTPAAPPSTPSPPPPFAYRSAFESYQAFSEEKVQSWKQANDTVGRIGGWRVYAKEAAGAPAPAEDAKDQDAKAPASQAEPKPAAEAVKPPAGHGHH